MPQFRGIVATLALLVVLTGCTSATTPNAAPEKVVLSFAHIDNNLEADPAAEWFIDEVRKRSGGLLTLDFKNECCGRANTAQDSLVEGVASGKFDIGWTTTRGFEDRGVTSFQALSAPFLIPNYLTQAAVLSSDIAKEMLPGASKLGVKAIALEPGVMRRPVAHVPLVRPADWKGITFWSYKSSVSDASIRALGATSDQETNDVRDPSLEDGTFDGYETSVLGASLSDHVKKPYITRNEALWARISVVIVNPKMFAGLTAQQRSWVTGAAAAVTARTSDVRDVDAAAVAVVCGLGATFVAGDVADIAAMKKSFAPVYSTLNANEQTRSQIAKIRPLTSDPRQAPNEYNPPQGCSR